MNTPANLEKPLRFVQRERNGQLITATRCQTCDGTGEREHSRRTIFGRELSSFAPCRACRGLGYQGIATHEATDAPPGTLERLIVYAARYQSGCDLWHSQDARVSDETHLQPWTFLGWSKPTQEMVNDEDEDEDYE